MLDKYLKLSISIILITVSTFPSQTSEIDQKTKALPILEKPALCINRPIGEFEGVCGNIGRFQVFCVGLNRFRTLPQQKRKTSNGKYIDFTARRLIHAYFNHAQENRTLDITKNAKPLLLGAKDTDWIAPPVTWNLQAGASKKLRSDLTKYHGISEKSLPKRDSVSFFCGHFSLEHTTFTHDINITTLQQPPQLLWLLSKDSLHEIYSYANQYYVKNNLNPPIELFVKHSGKRRTYKLIGMSLGHIYSSRRLSMIDYGIKYFAPSKFLIDRINRQWCTHIDACVRYGQDWYVMDDETRLKATAIDKNGNTDTNPKQIAYALAQHYPGMADTLLYELVDKQEPSAHSAHETDGSLLLERDTPRPMKKACFALVAAPLIDGLAAFALLSPSIFFSDTTQYAAIGAATTACISFYHHLQHIRPMFKKTIQYKHIQGARRSLQGPRAPLFSRLLAK